MAMARRIQLLAFIICTLQACGGDATGPSTTAPQIVSIGPNRARPNTGEFYLVVRGHHFHDSSVVHWNGSPRQTTFLDSARLVAFIRDQDIAAAGTGEIVVVNPNGERSAPVSFTVADNAIAFGVDSILPPCCGDASAGVTVAVYFNETLDVESLGDGALRVFDDTTPVAGTVTYDAGSKSLRFSTPLPALRRYTVRATDALRSTSGGGLQEPVVWNFTTARGAIVALGSGDFASLALGAGGRPRIAYRWMDGVTFAMSLRLATCTADCTQRGGWATQTVDGGSGGKVGLYASMTANSSGGLHVAYQDFGNDVAKFATIGGGATTVQGSGGAAFTSLAVGPANRLYLTYFDAATGDLRSATCTASCLTAANWTVNTVDTAGNVGAFSSVAVDAGGTVHVTYFENDEGDLRYAMCPGPCTAATWTTSIIDTTGRVGLGSSLVVDGNGGSHVTYYDQTNGTVKYGACTASCEVATNWITSVLTPIAAPNTDVGFYTPSLALGPGAHLEVAFANYVTSRYESATCSTSCTSAGAWTVEPVSLQGPGFGGLTSLKVDAAGLRHLAWTHASGMLQYMQY